MTITSCSHGMPTPASCIDCIDTFDTIRYFQMSIEAEQRLDGKPVAKARIFTALGFAHAAYLQGEQPQRKYTGDDYIVHPIEVATILMDEVDQIGHTETIGEAIVVALLHDVLEDTPITGRQLMNTFGHRTVEHVAHLTDPVYPSFENGGPNRAGRKNIDARRLADSPGWIQTIKVADLMSNTRTIVEHDPDFAVTYLAEKKHLLDVMTEADPNLRAKAYSQVVNAERSLGVAPG